MSHFNKNLVSFWVCVWLLSGAVLVSAQSPVQVPEVVNLNQSEAHTALLEAGLVVGGITQESHPTTSAGIVLSQEPAANATVDAGSPVTIVVSVGITPITVDFSGRITFVDRDPTSKFEVGDIIEGSYTFDTSTPEEAFTADRPNEGRYFGGLSFFSVMIRTKGFHWQFGSNPCRVGCRNTNDRIQTFNDIDQGGGQFDDQMFVASSTPISVSPVEGNIPTFMEVNFFRTRQTVPPFPNMLEDDAVPNSPLIFDDALLFLAYGDPGDNQLITSVNWEPLDLVPVPYVVGTTQEEAEATIQAVGLIPGTITTQTNSSVPVGHVISQNPTPTVFHEQVLGSEINFGFFSNIGPFTHQVGADQFTLSQDSMIDGLQWYGHFNGIDIDPGVVALDFDISFFSETNGLPDKTPIYKQTASARIRDTGMVVSGSPQAGRKIYEFVADGIPPFSVTAGQTVWISIAESDDSTEAVGGTQWLWNFSPFTADDTKAFRLTSTDPDFEIEDWELSTQLGQLAFSLLGSVKVPDGSTVDLVVSLGAELITVPDVGGLLQAEAEDVIGIGGLMVGTIDFESSDQVPAGTVIRQDPPAGTEVEAGTKINLVISSGLPPQITVPNVVEQAQATAESLIRDAGLVVGIITFESSDTVPVGSVIRQTPNAGTEVAENQEVHLVLSSGGMPVFLQSPNQPGQFVIEAENFSSREGSDARDWLVVPSESSGVPSEFLNFRGSGYIQALPDSVVGSDPLAPPFVDYKICIQQPGTYRLFARWDSINDQSDTFYASVVEIKDGTGGSIADWYRYVKIPDDRNFATEGWFGNGGFEQTNSPFSNGEAPVVWEFLNPGIHTLRLDMREDGAAIDALVFQLSNLTSPAGDGPDVTPIGILEDCQITPTGPDLSITTLDKNQLKYDGQTLSVSGSIGAILKNNGNEPIASSFDLLFFEDRNENQTFDQGVDENLGFLTVSDGLGPGETLSVTTALSGTVLFSGNVIWGFVDSQNVVVEANENNNFTNCGKFCLLEDSPDNGPVTWRVEDGGNGHTYQAVLVPGPEGINWTDANAAAESLGNGWHLATITSQEENDFIFSLVTGKPEFWNCCSANNSAGPWLGGIKVGPGVGDYAWVTDEPFEYTNWGPLEPFGNGERIGLFGFRAAEGPFWNDIGPDRIAFGYVIETDQPVQQNPVAVPAPDLTASFVQVFSENDNIKILARIGNGGAQTVGPGLAVSFYDGDPLAGGLLLGRTTTSQSLSSGQHEDVMLVLPETTTTTNSIWVVVDDPEDSSEQIDECNETNNIFNSEVILAGPPLITVPNFIGLPQEEAEAALAGTGLELGEITFEYSDTTPAGSVISHTPEGGAMVATGSPVNLVVSLGVPVAVPSLIGLRQGDAEQAIVDGGFVVGDISSGDDPLVPVGQVREQTPVEGSQVAAGSPINISISAGPGLVSVPNLMNLSQEEAGDALSMEGLRVACVATSPSLTVSEGIVIDQHPVEGSRLAPGSGATLVVSSGPSSDPQPEGTSSGIFQNPQGPPGMVTTGVGTNQFTWGNPGSFGTGPSSLNFVGDTFPIVSEEEFKLGTLSYFNGTINEDTQADSVDLNVKGDLTLDGSTTSSLNFVYGLDLINSPNIIGSPPADQADIVFLPNLVTDQIFQINGVDHTLQLTFGDVQAGGFSEQDRLFAFENENACAEVRGTFIPLEQPGPNTCDVDENHVIDTRDIIAILLGHGGKRKDSSHLHAEPRKKWFNFKEAKECRKQCTLPHCQVKKPNKRKHTKFKKRY